jgi:hypothetical protein
MKKALLLATTALLLPGVARAANVTMVSRDVPIGSRTLQAATAPIRFDMLGLHWRGTGAVSYRTRSSAGRWSAWREADADGGPDAGSREIRPGWHDGNLDWTGPASAVQFQTSGRISRLRAYYLWSRATRRPERTLSLAGSPAIVPRADWEADEKIVRAQPLYAPTLKLAVVHHTAGTNDYTPAQAAAIVRGIEVYHVKGNGWNDIGYNFLVDRYGTVYEGRGGGMTRNVIGAHALGFNNGTVGVALIGNFTTAKPPAVMENALVSLLAWRLDLAHLDPLSKVVYTSGGNSKFHAGKVVTLRAISGHRDTGPSECPGNAAYALLPAIADRVARTGLPKLYSPVVSGAAGGDIRFQARLSSTLPWTITVTDSKGRVVASRTGTSELVDWTWSSAKSGKGPFAWSIAGGRNLLSATGAIGARRLPPPPPPRPTTPPAPAPAPRTPSPAPPPVPGPAPRPVLPPPVVAPPAEGAPPVLPVPAPGPAPAPAVPPVPLPALITGLTASPSVLTANPDGTGLVTSVDFVLAQQAQVTVRVGNLQLLAATVSAGHDHFEWDLGRLVDGRYQLVASAKAGTRTGTQSVDVVVDRTLSGVTATPTSFSPNADGASDTISFGFVLAQSVPVQVTVQRAGAAVATVFAGQLGPGPQTIGWDGSVAGVRLPDGQYTAVVTATDALATLSLLVPFTVDTTPPTLTVLDGPSLRFQLSEPATVTAAINGQSVSAAEPAGVFTFPWVGPPVTSWSVSARDGAGNAGASVSGP